MTAGDSRLIIICKPCRNLVNLVYIHTHIQTPTHTPTLLVLNLCKPHYTHMHTHIQTPTHTPTLLVLNLCKPHYTHIHTHIYIYITHTYTHTYIYTLHTHTHTHKFHLPWVGFLTYPHVCYDSRLRT